MKNEEFHKHCIDLLKKGFDRHMSEPKIKTNPSRYKASEIKFMDSKGKVQGLILHIDTERKLNLSLENFCGVNLLEMLDMIVGKKDE